MLKNKMMLVLLSMMVVGTASQVSAQVSPETEWLEQAEVCWSEATRSEQDCYAIRQTAIAIAGCINSRGVYTRCSNPHVRRETAPEALRRHSGRVLGLRPTTRLRLLAIRQFNLAGDRPALIPEADWVVVRPYWLQIVQWAHNAVTRNPRVCAENPTTWGGVVDMERINRMLSHGYVRVNCGNTRNIFLRYVGEVEAQARRDAAVAEVVEAAGG